MARIVREIRRVRPQVIVTFRPEGAYGHPDHIAISQFATAAAVCAGDAEYDDEGGPSGAHRVSRLYCLVWTPPRWAPHQQAFRDFTTTVDGVERRSVPCPDWVVTTVNGGRRRESDLFEGLRPGAEGER